MVLLKEKVKKKIYLFTFPMLRNANLKNLKKGEQLTFEIKKTDKGPYSNKSTENILIYKIKLKESQEQKNK